MQTQTQFQEAFKISKQFAEDLAKPFLGREDQAKLITIALMTREHLVMFGEPGTAKSALVRRAAELLNAKFFLYLLSKYTEPAELFGPIDVLALKQGVFKRITENRLPEAEIVFLDEIFNANSSILNTLLSVINERVIYDRTQMYVPLWSLFAASNNVPEDPQLDALYDRLLLRDFVSPLSETLWTQMIKRGFEMEYNPDKPERRYSLAQFKKIYDILPSVNIDNVVPTLSKILIAVAEKGILVTDRRKGKILKMISASAILNGRTYAIDSDLSVLKNILANTNDEYINISTILTDYLRVPEKYMHELTEIENNIREVQKQIHDPTMTSKLTEIMRSLRVAYERVEKMGAEAPNDTVKKKADEVLGLLQALIQEIAKELGVLG